MTRNGSSDKAAGLIRRRIRKILQTKRERERRTTETFVFYCKRFCGKFAWFIAASRTGKQKRPEGVLIISLRESDRKTFIRETKRERERSLS